MCVCRVCVNVGEEIGGNTNPQTWNGFLLQPAVGTGCTAKNLSSEELSGMKCYRSRGYTDYSIFEFFSAHVRNDGELFFKLNFRSF